MQLLVKKVRRYNKQLHRYGFKDYQVSLQHQYHRVAYTSTRTRMTTFSQVAEGFEKVSKRLFLRMILRRALYLVGCS